MDPEARGTHFALGYVQMVSRRFELAEESLSEALSLNPSLSLAHVILGSAYVYNGMSKDALRHLDVASRLSPRDFNLTANYSVTGLCRLIEGEFRWLRRSRFENTGRKTSTALQYRLEDIRGGGRSPEGDRSPGTAQAALAEQSDCNPH